MEAWRRKTFGEDISKLVSGGDELHDDIAANHLLSDEVVINFNMFGSRMKHGI
jgi:hypothetical protein